MTHLYIYSSLPTLLCTIMITFCKKTVHSFLRITNSKDVNETVKPPSRCRNIPTPVIAGLSFITVKTTSQRPTNVLESSTILKSTSTSSSNTAAAATCAVTTTAAIPAEDMMKKDACGIGFIDAVGGEVNGLMSCTESLGFESSDERRTDEQIEEMNINQDKELCSLGEQKWRRRSKTMAVRREVKKLPPPLSSLNKNGQPNFFFRAVRKNGRLELTEIRIDRPEILRASRQDGRLTLHLIQTEEEEEEEEGEEEEEEEEEEVEKIEEEEREEEERSGEWMFPVNNGGGDGFRRCHELVNRHHHHHHNSLQVWSQQCVTST